MRIVKRDNSYIQDHDERCVADVLCSLDEVKTPKDFAFKVRAGIANGRPIETLRVFNVFKYVMPTALVAVTGLSAFVVWNLPETPQLADGSVPAMTNTFVMSPPASDSGSSERVASTDVELKVAPTAFPPVIENTTIASTDQPSKTVSPRSDRTELPQRVTAPAAEGGSIDRALSRSKPVLLPRGIDPERTQDGDTRDTAKIDIRSALEVIGVNVQNKLDGWHVNSMKSGSVLARLGVNSGDVITAVNGRSVVGTTTMSAGAITSITINRGGQVLTLSMR